MGTGVKLGEECGEEGTGHPTSQCHSSECYPSNKALPKAMKGTSHPTSHDRRSRWYSSNKVLPNARMIVHLI